MNYLKASNIYFISRLLIDEYVCICMWSSMHVCLFTHVDNKREKEEKYIPHYDIFSSWLHNTYIKWVNGCIRSLRKLILARKKNESLTFMYVYGKVSRLIIFFFWKREREKIAFFLMFVGRTISRFKWKRKKRGLTWRKEKGENNAIGKYNNDNKQKYKKRLRRKRITV